MNVDITNTITIHAESCPIIFEETFPLSQASRNIVKLQGQVMHENKKKISDN